MKLSLHAIRNTKHERRATSDKRRICSTTVESPLQINPFCSNKPNFRKSQMNVSPVITKEYENKTLGEHGKNKPNSNPIQTQYKANTNPIQTQNKPKQSQFLYHWFCFLFTIAPMSCEFDKEFCVWISVILLFKSV